MVWRPCRSFKLLELVGACALYMLCRSVLPPPLLVSTLARIIIVAGATTKTGSTISGTEAGVDIAQLADANRHGVETNSSPAMTIVAQEMDALRNKGRMAADRELHRHLSNFTSPSRGSVNQTNREFVYEPDQATLAMVSSTLRKSCGNKIEQVQGVSVRRVAVAFRGGSFRVGFSDQVRACDGASYEMQKAIAGSIQHAVLEPLEAAGLIVDTFVQTLPCPTKQNQFYTQDLCDWLNATKCDVVGASSKSLAWPSYMQGRNQEGALEMVRRHADSQGWRYDYVLTMRVDMLLRGTLAELFPPVRWLRHGAGPSIDTNAPLWTRNFFSKDFFFLGFTGCALEAVIASLHRGCFEASPYGDFVSACVPELRGAGLLLEDLTVSTHVAYVDNLGLIHVPPHLPTDKTLVLQKPLARFQLVWPYYDYEEKFQRPLGDNFKAFHFDPPLTLDNFHAWKGVTNASLEVNSPWSNSSI